MWCRIWSSRQWLQCSQACPTFTTVASGGHPERTGHCSSAGWKSNDWSTSNPEWTAVLGFEIAECGKPSAPILQYITINGWTKSNPKWLSLAARVDPAWFQDSLGLSGPPKIHQFALSKLNTIRLWVENWQGDSLIMYPVMNESPLFMHIKLVIHFFLVQPCLKHHKHYHVSSCHPFSEARRCRHRHVLWGQTSCTPCWWRMSLPTMIGVACRI